MNVFWVVGDVSSSSVLITDYLTTNQYRGDRFRRVFPLSAFDFSIELTVNRSTHERTYSCVIDGATEMETTLFTYLVRTIGLSIDPSRVLHLSHSRNLEPEAIARGNATAPAVGEETKKIVPHDALVPEQIDSLREQHRSEQRHSMATLHRLVLSSEHHHHSQHQH